LAEKNIVHAEAVFAKKMQANNKIVKFVIDNLKVVIFLNPGAATKTSSSVDQRGRKTDQ